MLHPNNGLGGCSFCGVQILIPPSTTVTFTRENILFLNNPKVKNNCLLTTEQITEFLTKSRRVQLDTNVTRVYDTVTATYMFLALRTRYLLPFHVTWTNLDNEHTLQTSTVILCKSCAHSGSLTETAIAYQHFGNIDYRYELTRALSVIEADFINSQKNFAHH